MPISLLNHIDVSFLSLYIAFIPLSIAQRIAVYKHCHIRPNFMQKWPIDQRQARSDGVTFDKTESILLIFTLKEMGNAWVDITFIFL